MDVYTEDSHYISDDPGKVLELALPQDHLVKLSILRSVLESDTGEIVPRLSSVAPSGHAFPEIEGPLGLSVGGAFELLEDLADRGLLDRTLHNTVHLCPHCSHCQINFRECCPVCDTIDVRIEGLVHHFRCAYVGVESEFQSGVELVCPKCRKRLDQLGQDFERPNRAYVCASEAHVFEEPVVQGQCLACAKEFHGSDMSVSRISRYRPTPLAQRAASLNRLTGLDISEVMLDAEAHMVTFDFLELEVEREVERTNRHGGTFSTGVLSFVRGTEFHPVFRDWDPDTIMQLARAISPCLRGLDLVARVDASRVGLVLPATDRKGAHKVGDRILTIMEAMAPSTRTGQPLLPHWSDATWSSGTCVEDVRNHMSGGA